MCRRPTGCRWFWHLPGAQIWEGIKSRGPGVHTAVNSHRRFKNEENSYACGNRCPGRELVVQRAFGETGRPKRQCPRCQRPGTCRCSSGLSWVERPQRRPHARCQQTRLLPSGTGKESRVGQPLPVLSAELNEANADLFVSGKPRSLPMPAVIRPDRPFHSG